MPQSVRRFFRNCRGVRGELRSNSPLTPRQTQRSRSKGGNRMGELPYNKEKSADCRAASYPSRTNMASFEPLSNLEAIPLFRGLNPKQLDWLRGRLYARAFPANKDMIVSGMPGDLLYL